MKNSNRLPDKGDHGRGEKSHKAARCIRRVEPDEEQNAERRRAINEIFTGQF
jgi:hypothetical protein